MKVLFFQQPDCAPCDIAKPKMAELVALGYEVETLSPTLVESHRDAAVRYKVKVTPTAVILDAFENRKVGFAGGLINVESMVRHLGPPEPTA